MPLRLSGAAAASVEVSGVGSARMDVVRHMNIKILCPVTYTLRVVVPRERGKSREGSRSGEDDGEERDCVSMQT